MGEEDAKLRKTKRRSLHPVDATSCRLVHPVQGSPWYDTAKYLERERRLTQGVSGSHLLPLHGRIITHPQSRLASTVAQKKRKHQDPYALAQARARKAANLSRRSTLETERSKALGDPVHGITTPFIESFDTALAIRDQNDESSRQEISQSPEDAAVAGQYDTQHLNYFVTSDTLRASVDHSERLTLPVPPLDVNVQDPKFADNDAQRHKVNHANAREALSRIVSLENSGARERKHVNIQRCIQTFGRHNTDKTLKPRLVGVDSGTGKAVEDAEKELASHGQEEWDLSNTRAGPDTGSSEVQIAILTAKIRSLAQFLESRGKHDKVNKRNLRLLVHRRQKLLRYLRRKERGGDRWQFLTKTLGLTDGTWQGEISL